MKTIATMIAAALLLTGCATTSDYTSGSSDAAVAARVDMRLDSDPELANENISLSVDNRVVTVSGYFSDPSVRLRAISIIRGTAGVLAVIDHSKLR